MRVSISKPYTTYVGASKEVLKEIGSVELHGLGEATANAIRASEMLVSLGYATLEKFDTLSILEPDRNGISRSRAKVIIKLVKAPGFEKIYNEFKNSRTKQE